MIKRTERSGYVLVMTLMMIALIVAIVTSMANKSSVHTRFLKTMIDREKAKALAWSGVQVALSQLATMHEDSEPKEKPDKEKKGDDKKKSDVQEEARQFLLNILPILNRWQTFKLTQSKDGVAGIIKVCIGSEDGKINLNHLFDFVQKKFVNEGGKEKDYKKVMQEVFVKLQEVMGASKLFDPFEKFLKSRTSRLNDPTELLEIKEFEKFKKAVFYEPMTNKRTDDGKLKQTVYLNDIFTLWSFQQELNPWLLSHSLKVLLGVKLEKEGENKFEEKKLQELLKKFTVEYKLPDSWNSMLKPLYGIEFERLPKEMRALMGTKFEPSVFSVLSYGTVGGVTQKLLIVLERIKSPKNEQSGSGRGSFEFRTRKFYWL